MESWYGATESIIFIFKDMARLKMIPKTSLGEKRWGIVFSLTAKRGCKGEDAKEVQPGLGSVQGRHGEDFGVCARMCEWLAREKRETYPSDL